MRGSRGYGGRDIRKVVHFPETSKPAPIVPKRLIRGVSERVDCFGEVVVSLNEKEAEAAIESLLAEGVQAIAICFLWSFRNPAHEQRVKTLVEKISKDVFVTCSVDIAPKWGEYERVTATALTPTSARSCGVSAKTGFQPERPRGTAMACRSRRRWRHGAGGPRRRGALLTLDSGRWPANRSMF